MLLALRLMPVAETVAIIYSAPVLVMLAAEPVLLEKVGLLGWISATLGFAGLMLIARPGSGRNPLGVALALTNEGIATDCHLLTWILARTESTVALMLQAALFGTVFITLSIVLGNGLCPWCRTRA